MQWIQSEEEKQKTKTAWLEKIYTAKKERYLKRRDSND
jgi:hypothetical protein